MPYRIRGKYFGRRNGTLQFSTLTFLLIAGWSLAHWNYAIPAFQLIIAGAVVMVPKRDRDGNAMSGVVLPDIAVPIASHGYMNAPLTVDACRQAGTYRTFAKTAAERQSGDERSALDTRYPGGVNEYVTKIRLATRALVADRLLLEEDAAVIVNAAAENVAFAPTGPRARGATAAR